MSRARPPIPAMLERRVLVEAGHRCAIPTCRQIEIQIHHIIPWAQCKKHEYKNLIALCANCHTRADKGEIDRKSLRIYKANLRLAHDRFSQFEIDTLFALYELDEGESLPWLGFLDLLLKRLYDAGFVELGIGLVQVSLVASIASKMTRLTPDSLVITKRGRAFIKSLGVEQPKQSR